MKQQEVFKKIGTIIKELNEQYDYLDKTEGSLNDLELELFVANAHFLADHSEVLKKLNLQSLQAQVKTPEPEPKKEEKYFEPLVQPIKPATEVKPVIEEPVAALPLDAPAEIVEPVEEKPVEEIPDEYVEDTPVPHIDLQGNGADDDFSYIRQEPEIIKHELILDESENWDDDEGFLSEELSAPKHETEHIPIAKRARKEHVEFEPEKPAVEAKAEIKKETPVAEKSTVEEHLTINQRMSAQLNETSRAAEHVHTQTISDLKQAITLNDKLLYIKDLFNGYNLAYSEAIDILNRFSSFDEAEKFLQSSYAVKNNWESKQATADKFYALLRRRYL